SSRPCAARLSPTSRHPERTPPAGGSLATRALSSQNERAKRRVGVRLSRPCRGATGLASSRMNRTSRTSARDLPRDDTMQMNVDGQRVKTLRLRQSWSQELLAEKAGVSMRTIQRIEGGDVASLQSLRAVAAALGVPAASLAVLPADTDSSPPQADAAAT